LATIQKRQGHDGSVTYRVQVRLKGAPDESASFDTKTAAKEWAQRTETAIKENRHFRTVEARRRTMADLIDRYIEQWLPQKAPSVVTQQFQLLWWREQIGDYILADLRPDVFIDARQKLSKRLVPKTRRNAEGEPESYKEKISSGTINRYFAALSPVFTVAVRELGWLHENPLRQITKLKEPKGRVRFLDTIELKRLLTACKASSNAYIYPFVLLALSTGMRKNEILGLRWADFDPSMKQLTLQDTKNGEKRGVPLAAQALDEVLRVQKVAERKLKKLKRPKADLVSKHVFPSRDGTGPLDIRVPWEKALEEAKIENFRIHDLRHTAASYLAMNGAGLLDIAHILGHKSLEMVRRYAHLSPQHTAKTLEGLGQRLFASTK